MRKATEKKHSTLYWILRRQPYHLMFNEQEALEGYIATQLENPHETVPGTELVGEANTFQFKPTGKMTAPLVRFAYEANEGDAGITNAFFPIFENEAMELSFNEDFKVVVAAIDQKDRKQKHYTPITCITVVLTGTVPVGFKNLMMYVYNTGEDVFKLRFVTLPACVVLYHHFETTWFQSPYPLVMDNVITATDRSKLFNLVAAQKTPMLCDLVEAKKSFSTADNFKNLAKILFPLQLKLAYWHTLYANKIKQPYVGRIAGAVKQDTIDIIFQKVVQTYSGKVLAAMTNPQTVDMLTNLAFSATEENSDETKYYFISGAPMQNPIKNPNHQMYYPTTVGCNEQALFPYFAQPAAETPWECYGTLEVMDMKDSGLRSYLSEHENVLGKAPDDSLSKYPCIHLRRSVKAKTRITVLRTDNRQPKLIPRTKPEHLFLKNPDFAAIMPGMDAALFQLREKQCLYTYIEKNVFYPSDVDLKQPTLTTLLQKVDAAKFAGSH